jgi:hypothetical protein
VALWLTWERWTDERPDFIRREVANIRTGGHYHADTWIGEASDTLDQWKRDLELAIDAADTNRIARPGYGCMGCPYVLSCGPASDLDDCGDPSEVAEMYAVSKARTAELEKLARVACDGGAIGVPGGRVGFTAKDRAVPAKGAGMALWESWCSDVQFDVSRLAKGDLNDATDCLARSFITAAKLGQSNVKALAKALHPEKEDKAAREALVESLTEFKAGSRFGVWSDD